MYTRIYVHVYIYTYYERTHKADIPSACAVERSFVRFLIEFRKSDSDWKCPTGIDRTRAANLQKDMRGRWVISIYPFFHFILIQVLFLVILIKSILINLPLRCSLFLASVSIWNPYQTWFSKRNQSESCLIGISY